MSILLATPLRCLPLLVLALMLGLYAPCQAAPGERLQEAASHLSAGNFDRARQLFAEEASADPLCAIARVGVGAADLLSGALSAARQSFADSLVLAPGLPAAHLGLGTSLCLTGSFRDALDHYHAALVGGAHRPSLPLAGEAYAYCALGQYAEALQQARAALGTDPEQPVAKYVMAAASLALGDPRPAAELDTEPMSAAPRQASPITLSSCLLSPETAYWQQHGRDHQAQLAQLGLMLAANGTTHPAPPSGPPVSSDFRIAAPRAGQVLEGATTIEVAADPRLRLDYVIVFVEDSFAGVTSVRPYKIPVDTRLHADGLTRIRVEGHAVGGEAVRSAEVAVSIRNGRRTYAPDELAVRRAVGELLEDKLVPPLSPLAATQLAGHGLMALGQPERAATAFEFAYARNAALPHLRDDLLLAYHALGLRCAAAAPEIHTLPRENRSVALTFDDGPHPLITPWLLDLLDKEALKATFFLVGKQALMYPELVREIRRRGHQIGSHSFAHYSMRHLHPVAVEQDLVKSRLAIREACGETVTLFRPPGGYYDATTRAAAGALGFQTVFWTCNITSYRGRDGRHIASSMARQCAEGGIILLHNGEDETLDALPYLIPELRSRGVTFVTIEPDHG